VVEVGDKQKLKKCLPVQRCREHQRFLKAHIENILQTNTCQG